MNSDVGGVAHGEEDPGAFIDYNNDDDNENGVPDYNDGASTAEDDLAKIDLIDCLPSGLTGYLELAALGTSPGFKVWSDEHKAGGSLVIPNGEYLDNYDVQWDINDVPEELWVEGSGTGTGQLSLRYSPDGSEFPGRYNADIIDVNIVQVHMNMEGGH